MINTEELKKEFKKHKIRSKDLAAEVNMDPATFSLKINNKSKEPLSIGAAQHIGKRLQFDDTRFMQIFFV